MIDYHEYRGRLERCLDERRDPLDEPDLVAFLDAHPELLEEFADQRADLRRLQQTATPATPLAVMARPASRMPMLTVAAAALVLGFGIAQFVDDSPTKNHGGGDRHTGTAQTTANEQPRPPRRGRILSASLREVEPRLRAAANYTLHEPLVQTKTLTLEAYEQRSELR